MKKKAALICSYGLGDGLIGCVVAYNLYINGYDVVVYHPFLKQLCRFFPYASFSLYPSEGKIKRELSSFDRIVINGDKSCISQRIVAVAKRDFSDRTTVLYPSTCKKKNLPGDFLWNQKISIGKNLENLCKENFFCERTFVNNGMCIPQKNKENLVIIHPTSSSLYKNWPKEKFIQLGIKIQKTGWKTLFVVMEKEKLLWQDISKSGLELYAYANLDDLVEKIVMAKNMIGNDSGIAHLSSFCHLPTVTICSTHRKGTFWAPFASKNVSVYPAPWIFNVKGMRLRDYWWKRFVSVSCVFDAWKQIADC
ncbi:MAG: glycosyltransferase family 9 protein [Parachlamydiales bacterium]|nr:glycosyltransferase family 9 protein [Parachlamydiales bacterium]